MLNLSKALLVMLLVSLVSAAQAENSLSLRLDIAGRQRMLTQRMARAACFIAVNVDVQSNKQVLLSSRTLFGNSLRQLKMGGGEESFLQETDEEVLAEISAIEKIWFKMQRKVTQFTKPGAVGLEELKVFSDISTELLSASNYLTTTIEDKATQGEGALDPVNAHLINVAGRQRMLVQKIGKEACLLQMERRGLPKGATIDTSTFNETMQIFHESAFGLAFGSRQMNLPAAPTEDIYDENGNSWQRWALMNALVSALEFETLTEQDMRELSWDIEAFMAELSATVKLYTAL